MSDNLEQEIKDVVVEIMEVDPGEVKLDGPLDQIMQIDSVVLLEVLVTLERKYDISIQEEELQQISKLGQVVELIRKKQAQKTENAE